MEMTGKILSTSDNNLHCTAVFYLDLKKLRLID
jgi:hypothetical protein